jgi:hypothetical protein
MTRKGQDDADGQKKGPVPPDRTPLPLPPELTGYRHKAGTPYSAEMKSIILDYVFASIADKSTLRKITAQSEIPSGETILGWIGEDPTAVERYAQARILRADARADRIDELVDMAVRGEIDPATAKVAIDAEKWQASKENVSKYGDRLDITGEISVSNRDPLSLESFHLMCNLLMDARKRYLTAQADPQLIELKPEGEPE